jgi:hypothetical protein
VPQSAYIFLTNTGAGSCKAPVVWEVAGLADCRLFENTPDLALFSPTGSQHPCFVECSDTALRVYFVPEEIPAGGDARYELRWEPGVAFPPCPPQSPVRVDDPLFGSELTFRNEFLDFRVRKVTGEVAVGPAKQQSPSIPGIDLASHKIQRVVLELVSQVVATVRIEMGSGRLSYSVWVSVPYVHVRWQIPSEAQVNWLITNSGECLPLDSLVWREE